MTPQQHADELLAEHQSNMAGMSAEEQIERKIDWLVREMEELCKLANDSETRDLIAKESVGVGQIHFRAGLILDFLNADQPSKFRVVSNGWR